MAGVALDMSLDDLIKNNKKYGGGGGGGGGGDGRGRGRASGRGPTRCFNNRGANRAAPYGGPKIWLWGTVDLAAGHLRLNLGRSFTYQTLITVSRMRILSSSGIDEYELVDPVDILTPLEKSGFWNGVKATKWSERKEAVTELTKLASTKKIAPGDFTEICRTLNKEWSCLVRKARNGFLKLEPKY